MIPEPEDNYWELHQSTLDKMAEVNSLLVKLRSMAQSEQNETVELLSTIILNVYQVFEPLSPEHTQIHNAIIRVINGDRTVPDNPIINS